MNIDNEKHKLEGEIRHIDEQIVLLQKLKIQHLARIHALNPEQEISSSLPSHHNQAFLPLDEKAIKHHIEGKDVIGVYPMTDDEKCFFLVFDFDKECWFDDINALRKTSKDEGINIGIERSRSGKGGHAWIFFEEAIPAFLA